MLGPPHHTFHLSIRISTDTFPLLSVTLLTHDGAKQASKIPISSVLWYKSPCGPRGCLYYCPVHDFAFDILRHTVFNDVRCMYYSYSDVVLVLRQSLIKTAPPFGHESFHSSRRRKQVYVRVHQSSAFQISRELVCIFRTQTKCGATSRHCCILSEAPN